MQSPGEVCPSMLSGQSMARLVAQQYESRNVRKLLRRGEEVTMRKLTTEDSTERVAGNGLLHRRALLGRGMALAGAMGASTGGFPTGAAAEPLVDAEWSLEPGNPIPAYQVPSKYAKNIVRTLSNPNFEPRTSQSRTPHSCLME
jgi:hypothetical protein